MLIRRRSDNQFIVKYDEKTKSFQTIATIKGALANGGNAPFPVAQRLVAVLASLGTDAYIADSLHGELYDPVPEPQPKTIYETHVAPASVIISEPEPTPVVVEPETPCKYLRPGDAQFAPVQPIRRIDPPSRPAFQMTHAEYWAMPCDVAQTRYKNDPEFRVFVDSLPAV